MSHIDATPLVFTGIATEGILKVLLMKFGTEQLLESGQTIAAVTITEEDFQRAAKYDTAARRLDGGNSFSIGVIKR